MDTPVHTTEKYPIGLDELTLATEGTVVRAGTASTFAGVSIDGRTAGRGEIYFAIRGETHDGHAFCGQAIARGVGALVVEKGRALAATETAGAAVIEVDDGRLAIGRLARAIRRRWGGPVIGVTGSTGKTTTKGLLAAMLAGVAGGAAEVLATEGSLNNETGVPLTLLRLGPRHRFAVVEMGMRGLGQIDYLAQWAEPDVGVVVNVGVAHVGVVGSVDAIARGKSEIWSRLRDGGKAVYPQGDARLAALATKALPRERHMTYGHEPGADVRVRDVELRGAEGSDVWFELSDGRTLSARVPLVGRHNADNAACAFAAARALGLDLAACARGLATARPAKMRGEIRDVGGRRVLVDCYNANPASMRAAIETLAELAGGHRAIAVLGDMLELGESETEEHAKIGGLLRSAGIDRVIAVGERARHYSRGASAAGVAHIVETQDPRMAARVLASWTDPGDWVLVKASRGMRLERVVDALEEVVG